MQKYRTQIIIVSGQMIPNVTPVMDDAICPEKVIICASNAMRERARILKTFFTAKQIEAEIFELGDAYAFEELQNRFMELAIQCEGETSLAVNLTGGTKLMTIAAQMVFEKRPCFYVIPEKDQIIMLDAANPALYEIADKIQLRDFFAIHGYTVTGQKRKKKISASTVDLAETLLKQFDRYKTEIGKLNYLAAKAEDAYSLTVKNEISDATCDLLDLFYKQGSISYYDDKKIEFASSEARDFCKGFWLEDYILSELSKADEVIGLQDWAGSIQIESASGTKNEIDAAFLYNNELYVIECKTARMDDKGDDVLYKIDTIRGYAGLYTKPIIATFKELNKYERQRARDLGITLIEGRNLNRFAEHLMKKIHPKGETE
ncbi:DUF1887 family protein [Verrucomicrobia bacterium S94]|nr:DUF1887 family protein [Verrucomicrobia bacterium S94]